MAGVARRSQRKMHFCLFPGCVTLGRQLHLSGLLPVLHLSVHTQLYPKGGPHTSWIYLGQLKGGYRGRNGWLNHTSALLLAGDCF